MIQALTIVGSYLALNVAIFLTFRFQEDIIDALNWLLIDAIVPIQAITYSTHHNNEKQEKDALIFITRLLTFNLLLTLIVLTRSLYNGHAVKFFFGLGISGILYLLGRFRAYFYAYIEKQHMKFNGAELHGEIEKRNVLLAQALAEAEHKIKKLEKQNTKPTPSTTKIQRPRHIIA